LSVSIQRLPVQFARFAQSAYPDPTGLSVRLPTRPAEAATL
jgi:hypothetical protein